MWKKVFFENENILSRLPKYWTKKYDLKDGGKQNYKCKTCNRQYVEGGKGWFVTKEQKLNFWKFIYPKKRKINNGFG